MLAQGYLELGMGSEGLIHDLKPVKRFLEEGLQSPPATEAEILWENGIAPRDLNELAAKTYVGGAIVETAWGEAMKYFVESPRWKAVASNPWATVFVRNRDAAREGTGGF